MPAEENNVANEITLSMEQVYKIAIRMVPVIFFIFFLPYIFIWFRPFISKLTYYFHAVFTDGQFYVLRPYIVKATVYIVGGIIVHELLHGLGWIIFARKSLRTLKFGFMYPEMAPYAHCTEALPVYAYRIGILLPAIVLGVFPAIYGIVTGSFSILLYGILFTWAASGDLIMFRMISHLKSNVLIKDHPKKLGCIIVDHKN